MSMDSFSVSNDMLSESKLPTISTELLTLVQTEPPTAQSLEAAHGIGVEIGRGYCRSVGDAALRNNTSIGTPPHFLSKLVIDMTATYHLPLDTVSILVDGVKAGRVIETADIREKIRLDEILGGVTLGLQHIQRYRAEIAALIGLEQTKLVAAVSDVMTSQAPYTT